MCVESDDDDDEDDEDQVPGQREGWKRRGLVTLGFFWIIFSTNGMGGIFLFAFSRERKEGKVWEEEEDEEEEKGKSIFNKQITDGFSNLFRQFIITIIF